MRAKLLKVSEDQIRPATKEEALGGELLDSVAFDRLRKELASPGRRVGAVDVQSEGAPPPEAWDQLSEVDEDRPTRQEQPIPRIDPSEPPLYPAPPSPLGPPEAPAPEVVVIDLEPLPPGQELSTEPPASGRQTRQASQESPDLLSPSSSRDSSSSVPSAPPPPQVHLQPAAELRQASFQPRRPLVNPPEPEPT
eukprot:9483636-Pyramimonas_sp.AAC.2